MTSATAVVSVFDALGDPKRLQIVIGLCDTGPKSTLQVAQSISLSRQATTKHLELLSVAGVVNSTKHGRQRVWTVQPQPLNAAGDYLTTLSARWDRAIERLRIFVED